MRSKMTIFALFFLLLAGVSWSAQEIVLDDQATPTPRVPSRRVPLWIAPAIAVASGTGTATTYIEKIPFTWDPTTKQILASGVPLIFTVTTSATSPFSMTLASETIGLMTRLAAILSSLASDAVGLKTNSTISTFTASIPTGTSHIGSVNASITAPLPTGTNTLGSMTVIALPSLPAGTNTVGSVTVITLPSLPAGTDIIGSVSLTLPGIPSQTVLLLDGTEQAIVSIANRRWVSLHATGTFEFSVGTTTVPANTTPVYNALIDCPASWPIGVKTSATGTYLTTRQGSN